MGDPARFKIDDRVATVLYGPGKILTYYRDRNIGWTYKVQIDNKPNLANLASNEIWQIEAVLELEPAVVQLANVVRKEA